MVLWLGLHGVLVVVYGFDNCDCRSGNCFLEFEQPQGQDHGYNYYKVQKWIYLHALHGTYPQ